MEKIINRRNWPATAYMKAVDDWTAACYFAVFCPLVEYCIVIFLTKKAEWEKMVGKVKK